MKKFGLFLTVASLLVTAASRAASFQDVHNWVGTGTNQAGFEIDWNDGTTNAAYIWGYRWNGDANGEQMLKAIVAADPRLYAEISGDTQFGKALFGFGLDHNADQVFPLNPALTFDTNHLAGSDYNSVDDNRTNVDAGDRWQEGWFSAGYWSYWLSDDSRLSEDFTDWDYSGVGMTGRILENGNWDGWSFARDFNDSLPTDPFPHTNLVTSPRPTIRLVHGFNGNDGIMPAGPLILQSNVLYGIAGGGANFSGVIFAVQTDGLAFTNLHVFNGTNDGSSPVGALARSNNVLYGTTSSQGLGGSGTLFSLGTDGSSFSTLYSFSSTGDTGTNSDGSQPYAGVVLGDSGMLFGSAHAGGLFGNGSLFGVGADGNSFTNLHSFTPPDPFGSNVDGAYPIGELTPAGGVLYGVAYQGGDGNGNIFKITADGSGFAALHEFSIITSSTNVDGAYPTGPLLLVSNVLYGTTSYGGPGNVGNVFSIHTDGSAFTILHNFTAPNGNSANSDGAYPIGGLIIDGQTLYGATQYGGKSGQGTVFQINTDGTGFYSLYQFPRLQSGTNAAGVNPAAGLIQSGSSFYGITSGGGPTGNGSVFALDLPNPPLAMSITNNEISVTWPIWSPNFTIEMSTDVVSGHWQTMTNQLSGTNFVFNTSVQDGSAFFRLKK